MPGTQAALLYFIQISFVGSNLPPLHLKCFMRNGSLNKYSPLGEIKPMAETGLTCIPLSWVIYSPCFSKSWILGNYFSGRIMIKRSYIWRHKQPNILFIAYIYWEESQGREGACVHAQLDLTLCGLLDCSPTGSSVHGISQQEWSGLPFPLPGESSQARYQTYIYLLHQQADSLPLSYWESQRRGVQENRLVESWGQLLMGFEFPLQASRWS